MQQQTRKIKRMLYHSKNKSHSIEWFSLAHNIGSSEMQSNPSSYPNVIVVIVYFL